jgi:signal peptidase
VSAVIETLKRPRSEGVTPPAPARPSLLRRSAKQRRPAKPPRKYRHLVAQTGIPAGTIARPSRPRVEAAWPVRVLGTLAGWIVMGAITGLLVALTIPGLFGYHNFIEMSGSMEPTIHVGDLVIDHSISPLDVRIGDVVTFKDPQAQTKLITHRVRSMSVHGSYVRFATKGDAVNSVQHWDVGVNGRVGRVVTHIPRLGYALFWATTRLGRLLLLFVPAVSLGLTELIRIWRPRRKRSHRAVAA